MGTVDLQNTFAGNISRLILWAQEQGYQVTFGESYDDDNVGHMKGSLHYSRLAQDLNLFRNGKLLTKSEDYKRLGEAWKALHPLNRWGGDFPGDGNHFSMEYMGRK
jgi:hypothetical protein